MNVNWSFIPCRGPISQFPLLRYKASSLTPNRFGTNKFDEQLEGVVYESLLTGQYAIKPSFIVVAIVVDVIDDISMVVEVDDVSIDGVLVDASVGSEVVIDSLGVDLKFEF